MGTKQGTVTDVNGRYSIGITSESAALTFSFIGFNSQTITLNSSNTVNVSLTATSKQLGEVLVTGYSTQTRSTTTGAIAQVNAKAFEDRSYTSADQALQGRVAGLQSTGSSGQPGALQEVRIRGIGSINANSNPLYVVDGIIINSGDLSRIGATTANALSGINPNDIETITVLKDASAAAIYGSRAANGVIVITTKSGKAGKTKIRLDAEFGLTKPGVVRSVNRPLTTDEYRTLTAEGLLNNPSYISQYGLTSSNVLQFVDENFGTNSGVNTNWLDLVQRTAHQQQYNLSVDGGDAKTQFHVSGGYFKQQGVVINSDFNRYSANIDLKHKVNDKLSFATSLIIGQNGQNTPPNGNAYENPVFAAYALPSSISPYNPDGSYNIDPSTFPSSNYNPLFTGAHDKNRLSQLKGLGSASGEYKILTNLKITSRIGIDYNNLEEDAYLNPVYGDGAGLGGLSARYYTRYFNWVWTNLVDYRIDLNHNHNWTGDIKAGYESQKSQYYDLNVTTIGFPANYNITVPSNGSTPLEALGTNEDYTVASLLALGDFSYKGKYVVSGSFRKDGSSRFGADNRYGNFWSVGGTWNGQKEAFFKDINWISVLRARATYGTTGNANIGNYNWRNLYSYGIYNGVSYNYNGLGGSAPTSVGNPNLTWETNKQLNLGFDFAVFKDRLSLTFDWYNRQATNLLLDQPTSLTTGFSSFTNNIGSMRNRGFEVTLSGTPVKAGGFRWDAGFNISKNNNKILALVNGKDQVNGSFINREGMDVQTFYLRQWAGVDPATGNALWYTDATQMQTTTDYNTAAQVAKYSASPKVFGSFTSTFAYKGISLDGLLYYNFGNYIQDGDAADTQSDGYYPSENRGAGQLNRWQKPGDVTNTPKYVFDNSSKSSFVSSRFLYKGDYARLRELTLAYTFPTALISTAKLSSLRIYVRGTNLATWIRDKNLPGDPEAGITSYTNFNITMPKIFTAGINVGF
ncbi:MAG: SusC/RagA family TonB-linked outer membrane protein [Sphingobacteriaceae bacterium]|nr:MAG: SusC/RagA family TonB-linked outer membrane protein [Sphingobacteriaceae bacterium]